MTKDQTSLERGFPKLHSVLAETSNGLSINGLWIAKEKAIGHVPPPLLKHYMVDESIQKVIEHNLQWAKREKDRPWFEFAYVTLPTECNQRCSGCFTGKDKSRLSPELNGPFYTTQTLDQIIKFLHKHRTKAIVYGGGGELFTWKGAFDYINQITDSGLGMVIFTNGTLLKQKDVERLADKDISLIISLRDIVEEKHDLITGANGFRNSLQTLEYALECGMQEENRLAVEMPVTKNNEERILLDFIPAMRYLRVIPFVEEFITISASEQEKSNCHTFSESGIFFKRMEEIDWRLGYDWGSTFGQRTQAQPKCQRPLYSFAIYPNGAVMDCPSHSISYGNFYQTSLEEVIYSGFKAKIKHFQLCPCSVFYTENDAQVPKELPEHLEALRK